MTKLNEQQLEGLKPLPEGKTAAELGYKVGDKFVVLDEKHFTFRRGAVVSLVDSFMGVDRFTSGLGTKTPCTTCSLAPYNPQKEYYGTPVSEAEAKEQSKENKELDRKIDDMVEKTEAPSWETLKYGDVVVNEYDKEAKVLVVLNDCFLRSCFGEFEVADDWFTKVEAQEDGWTVKQPTNACDKCNK